MAAVPADAISKEQKDELMCTYAALILHDDGADISAENMNKLISSVGHKVEAYWPTLFSRLLQGKDVGEMLSSTGGGGGGAAPAAAGGDAGAAAGGDGGAAKKEEVVEEEEEEEMEFDLFG